MTTDGFLSILILATIIVLVWLGVDAICMRREVRNLEYRIRFLEKNKNYED